ncbi:MDR family MFS transporter [Micromonospora sp. KC213]|uniref:MDR family MFS transporter n=1 Tax=Micromonospora sp. KC213 TaxID=2530378 RepID=UPI001052B43E|nr:MDR family MFS transporter [Micromonospora sp. KC213]TDC42868.1 DHA2 family efflux MFS transporter permease subunit [Micromonospora sp. KC213]
MTDHTTERLDRRLVGLGIVIVAGAFMSALDATIVSVALDRIGRDFDSPLGTLQWVSVAYLLALAMVVPVTGWSVERFGARRMWLFALTVFVVASALCGLAWSIESLIAFRVLQGIGGGLIPPLAQVILVAAAGPLRIGRVMSMVSVPTQLAPVLGPTVGGFLVDGPGWPWIFFVNIPLGAIALALAWIGLPRDERRRPAARPDMLGLLLLSPAITALVYGLSLVGGGGEGGGANRAVLGSVEVLLSLGGGAVLLVAFLIHARRGHPSPAIDLRLFGRRTFALAAGLIFLSGASLFGMMFLLPLFHQQARGLDALRAGLMLAPQGVGMVAALFVVGALVDRFGARYIVLTGLGLVILGTLPFTRVDADVSDPWLAGGLVVRGIGLGAASIPLTATAYRFLPADLTPRAATALVVVQRLGASFGTAALALLLQRELDRPGASPDAAFGHMFWWMVGLGLLAVLPAAFLPGPAQTREPPADAEQPTPVTGGRPQQ